MEGYYEYLSRRNFTELAQEILERNSGFDNDDITEDDLYWHIDELVADHMEKTDEESFEGKTVTFYHTNDRFNLSRQVKILENGTEYPGLDYAILSLDDTYPSLQSGDNVTVGEEVFVLGFPYITTVDPSKHDGSVTDDPIITKGIVTGIKITDNGIKYYSVDATATFGSSGSPVFNNKGKVIGILTAGTEGDEDISLILPMDEISEN